MTEQNSQSTSETVPTIIMDTGVGKHLESSEVIDVNNEHLALLMEKVPEVDPSKVRLRLVGFYDKEYAISEPNEQGIVTITLPAKNTDKVLPAAMSEYADILESRPAHTSTSEAMIDMGEAASNIVDRNGSMGVVAMAAMPELISVVAFRDIGESFSPGKRRGRKLAKAVKKTPSFTVRKRE